jgi:penicillin-binding protein 1C
MKRVIKTGIAALLFAASLLFIATWVSLKPAPELYTAMAEAFKPQLLDRNGIPLTTTYQNKWNQHDIKALYDIPLLLQRAFITSEDKRFFEHNGIDWRARLHAVWQNLSALGKKRGASTISEQVVRMLHSRPRTLWSRWLEGFEACRLEAIHNKADILEFYLNQVPYAGQSRGVAQAARFYFNRDLSTLTEKEMLALAVMVRAPAYLNVHNNPGTVEQYAMRLAERMRQNSFIDQPARDRLDRQSLYGSQAYGSVQARHFARYVFGQISGNLPRIQTTLDSTIQSYAQGILNQRLDLLDDKSIDNAALLVVDHTRNEVLAWVIGYSGSENETGVAYDAVLTPRQPGSTLKPFVYALALTQGWTAATLIDDSPLSESVGHGLHTYHNYSRVNYGKLSMREALGNSLNIPAVKAMQFVGSGAFLDILRKLGINSLDQHPDYYGDGLALGNGEVSLFELVQAYSALARGGVFKPLQVTLDTVRNETPRQVFSEPVATLIGHILADPDARRLEFSGNLLNLPIQTAVKTGTSSDYRDAWAVGYDHRFVVGVWMGNLKGESMNEITGSTGPAQVLRSLFSELNRNRSARPLLFSPLLVKRPVCIDTGFAANAGCAQREEWFIPDMLPDQPAVTLSAQELRIRQPHNGLQMALDPRIPDELEAFSFQLNQQKNIEQVDWYLNGALIATSHGASYDWQLQRGRHVLVAKVRQSGSQESSPTQAVEFLVK